jgi:hypothetical protein
MKKYKIEVKRARQILREHKIRDARLVPSGIPFVFLFSTESYAGHVNTLHRSIYYSDI